MADFSTSFDGAADTVVGAPDFTLAYFTAPENNFARLTGSGGMKVLNGTGGSRGFHVRDAGAADHFVEAVVGSDISSAIEYFRPIVFRANSSGFNGYGVSYNLGFTRIYLFRQGTVVGDYVTALVAGDVVRAEAEGDEYRVYLNGTLVITYTPDPDEYAAHTYVGFYAEAFSNTGEVMRSWSGGELAPADTTGPDFGSATLSFVTKTDTTVTLTTSAAATDAVGVTGYEWSSDNGATYPFTSLSNSFAFSSLTALTSYNFRVRAYDAAGNRSTTLTLTTSTYRAGDTGQNIVDDTVVIPGVQEEGFLYNDVVLPADAAKWFSYNITTPVSDTGSLTLYPNGSFIWVGLSADSFYYQLEVDGANVGSPQLVSLDPADGPLL